jgi:rubrerythrin
MATDRARTRRELVVSAAARAASDDRRHLERLLAFEELAVDVYGMALGSRRLTRPARRLVREIRAQEQSHLHALAARLRSRRRGGPISEAEVERRLGAEGIRVVLAELRHERAWLGLLAAVEDALEGAYYLAIKHLIDGEAALLASQILANEAQHSSVLSELLRPGRPALAVPDATVEGTAAPPAP